MLVARESFNYDALPQRGNSKKPRKRRVRKFKAGTTAVYCAIVLVTLSLAFMLASRQAHIASAGYDIVSMGKQAQSLSADNEALQSKVDQLKSLENIEYMATTKLGMQKPELAEGVQFVPVEYSKADSRNNIGVAAIDESNMSVKPQHKKNSIVQALAKIING